MDGKTYGSIAFFISETIVVLGIIAIVVNALTSVNLGGVLATHVFTLQGAIFTATWGAVVAKKVTTSINTSKNNATDKGAL